MAKQAENEGFRMLDDFVCEAILAPGIPQADPRKQGSNAGMQLVEELAFEERNGNKGDGKTEDKEHDKSTA
jgi:hypothetical protein